MTEPTAVAATRTREIAGPHPIYGTLGIDCYRAEFDPEWAHEQCLREARLPLLRGQYASRGLPIPDVGPCTCYCHTRGA